MGRDLEFGIILGCLLLVGIAGGVGLRKGFIENSEYITRKEQRDLEFKIDSLMGIIKTQDRIIEAQRLHFDSCAYISKGQIKKVTNKYWIELRKDNEIW